MKIQIPVFKNIFSVRLFKVKEEKCAKTLPLWNIECVKLAISDWQAAGSSVLAPPHLQQWIGNYFHIQL